MQQEASPHSGGKGHASVKGKCCLWLSRKQRRLNRQAHYSPRPPTESESRGNTGNARDKQGALDQALITAATPDCVSRGTQYGSGTEHWP